MKQRITAFLKSVPIVTRYLIIAGVALLIGFLFPNTSSFNYQYEEDGLWRYNDLVAPIDYAVQKRSADYQAEIEALENSLYPYYIFDRSVVKAQKDVFASSFNTKLLEFDDAQFPDVRARRGVYMKRANQLLENLYKNGIIELDKQHQDSGNKTIINLFYSNDKVEKRRVKNLMNVAKAQSLAGDSLLESKLEESEFLLNLVEKSIVPNIVYSDSINQELFKFEKDKISKSKGKVAKGDIIVTRGQNINADTYQKLISLEGRLKETEHDKNEVLVFVGYIILTLLLLGALVFYLAIFAKDIFTNLRKFSFIMLWIVVFSYLAHSIQSIGYLNAYMIPFCIVPIVIKNFYDERLALFTHIIIVLLAGFLAAQGYEFLFVQILVGMVVVLADVKTRNLSAFFRTMVYLFGTYTVGYLALEFINVGELKRLEVRPILWIGLNVLLTLLAFLLVPMLERIFGFTSDMTLIELSSLDKPLLKELALKAPGTLQHSLQVGNLAENAASEIGANALLVKVAALYHDIGKMKSPFHFIENQSGQNLHKKLTALESAKIILEHVKEGERRAKKEGLPKVIIDFISTHHGTTRVEYFYKKHMKGNPDEEVNPDDFTYKGMKPQTKEQAIMMMADSIEAAAKSLPEHTSDAIDGLVEKIVKGKMEKGQFEEAPLTLKELTIVKNSFKKLLKSIYHVRIQYPSSD